MTEGHNQRPAGWIPPQHDDATHYAYAVQAEPMPQPKPKRQWGAIIVALIAGLLVGALAMGAGVDDSAAPSPTASVTVTHTAKPDPVPAETVTVTAAPEGAEAPTVEVTVTETVTADAGVAVEADEAAPAADSGPATSFGDGTHAVGVDIEPGDYRTDGGSFCYWARLSGFSGDLDDILANEIPVGPTRVTIRESDAGFESNGCGTWERVG